MTVSREATRSVPVQEPLVGTDVRAATIAGATAALAYVVEMTLDLKTFKHDADDLYLLGGVAVRHRPKARALGLLIHLGAGATLGVVYAAVARDRLPGPPWLRGLVFASLENVGLYPLALMEDHHPRIKQGDLGRYWDRTAFLQSVPRHVVFGIVVGALYERLRPSE